MTSKEIRDNFNARKEKWNGSPIYTGSHGARDVLLIEIVAQLAEINENLRKIQEKG